MEAYAALGKSAELTRVTATTPRPLGVTPMAGYVMSLPSTPLVPVNATFPVTEPLETSGLTMYQATPAWFVPPRVMAVSRAPHTFPFAYITCCMRVSFASSFEMTSLWAGSAPNRRRQQPTPAIVLVIVSLMQLPCGVDVVGGVADPGWLAFPGKAYGPTPRRVFERLTEGVAVLSDKVLVRAQRTILLEV